MFERFTDAARATVVAAQDRARELGHSEIGAEHLLLALLADETGVAAQVLQDLHVDESALRAEVQAVNSPDAEALSTLGIDLDEVRRRAEATFGAGALSRPRRQRRGLFGRRYSSGGHLPFTDEARSALERSLHEAVALRHAYIGSEHLLLGLLSTTAGTAGRLLSRVGVTADAESVRQLVLERLRRTA
jgi:ATP-dependent Clp protease ATP-binding subunit ClpA